MQRKPSRATPNRHLLLSAKVNGTQKRTLAECIVYILRYATRHLSGWSNIEKQKKNQAFSLNCYQVTLVKRRQSVSYSVSRKFHSLIFKNSLATFWKYFRKVFNLSFTLTNAALLSSAGFGWDIILWALLWTTSVVCDTVLVHF